MIYITEIVAADMVGETVVVAWNLADPGDENDGEADTDLEADIPIEVGAPE